jgi:hypothetical protein
MSGPTIKTLVLVTLVAILIWVYAESESLRTEDLGVTVTFYAPPATGRAVWLADSPGRPVDVKLRVEGATAAIDALRNQIRTTIQLEPGVELPTEAAEHSIDLRAALRLHAVFAQSGVTIAEVTPSTVTVRVDELETYQTPIRIELPPGTDTVGPTEAQPALATVTLPQLFATPEVKAMPVIARLDRGSLEPLIPGRLERIAGVPLLLPPPLRDRPHANVTPAAATVTITLRDQTDFVDLPTVSVQIRISPVALQEWEVDIPEDSRFLRNVRVTGPRDLIEQIKDGKLPIIAYIALTPEDLTRGVDSKDAVFTDLPNGQLKFETEDRTVKLVIRRREEAEPRIGPPDGPMPPSP